MSIFKREGRANGPDLTGYPDAAPLEPLEALDRLFSTHALAAAEDDFLGDLRAAIADPDPDAQKRALLIVADHLARLYAGLGHLDRSSSVFRRPLHEVLRSDPLAHMAVAPSSEATRAEAATSFELDPNDRFTGLNWHEPERNEIRSYRWSGPGHAASIIAPSLGGGALTLDLEIWTPDWLTLDEDVTVCACDRELEAGPSPHGEGWRRYRVDAPEGRPLDRFALFLEVARMEAPCDHGPSEDKRVIGVGFGGLRLKQGWIGHKKKPGRAGAVRHPAGAEHSGA